MPRRRTSAGTRRRPLPLGPLRGLTVRGRAVLAAGVSAIVCAIVLGQSDLLRVGVLLVVLPVACALVLARRHFRLSCTRTLVPHRVQAGQKARVRLELVNVSTVACSVMMVEERVPFALGTRPRFVLPGLAAGERRGVTYSVRSEVRGRFTIGPLAIRMTDPFGLVEHARSFTARDQLVVTPRVYPLPGLPWRGDWGGRGESRPRAVAASGEDDIATREYRHGDDLRRVHWRSTARRGELMVRREEQPWQSRASILIDRRTTAHAGEGLASSLEWVVSAAASIAHHLVGLGYLVRLLDGPQAHPWTDPAAEGDGPLLDHLAVLEPASSSSLQEGISLARTSQSGGLLVAVVGHLDDDLAAELSRLRRQGTSCVAVVVDTASFRARPAASAAGVAGGGVAGAGVAGVAGADGSPARAEAGAGPEQPPDGPGVDPAARRSAGLLRAAGWAVATATAADGVAQAWEQLRTDDQVLTVVQR